MKFYFAILGCSTAMLFAPYQALAQKGKAAKTIVTLLTGAAAAEATAQTLGAKIDYDATREELRRQGCTDPFAAVYSLYFSLNGDVSSMMWADVFSKPDIFAVVSIEGQGQFLIPEIYNEYSGQAILLNLVAKQAVAGQRIVVAIYDDDSFGNAIWNNILQTRVNYNISGYLNVLQALRVNGEVGGQIKLLDRDSTIDAPDFIAMAEFKVPQFTVTSDWVAKGPVVDSSGRTLGQLQFSHVWSPTYAPVAAMKSSQQSMVFWAIIAFVCVATFGKLIFSRSEKKQTLNKP